MNNDQNFLDSKTVIAILAAGLVFFGWQTYLSKKYPDYYKPKSTQVEKSTPPGLVDSAAPVPAAVSSSATVSLADSNLNTKSQVSEKLPLNSPYFKADVNSVGLGLVGMTLKDYTDRSRQPVHLGVEGDLGIFSISLLGDSGPLPFTVSRTSENEVVGSYVGSVGELRAHLTVDPGTGRIDSTLTVLNPTNAFKGFEITINERLLPQTSSSFLMPNLDHQEFFYKAQDKVESVLVSKEPVSKEIDNASMVAIGSQYFVTAFLDKSPVVPRVEIRADLKAPLVAKAIYRPTNLSNEMVFHWLSYSGGKSLQRLEAADPEFGELVKLGFWGFVGRILLNILIWAHGIVGNWGWAIIVLTLLVRAVVLPFNLFSYKSMKKMQAIQPQLQSLKEKFKGDPAAYNRESMNLMKTAGANPIGGCLPIFLQMPIFFAFYQVLGQSIELYQAPFIGWIQDLSLRDPWFVLPVLVTGVMYLQQKMTPTTMDPAQAKILAFMPLMFGFFTVSLPSGLTLYMFVSTLFSVTQQQFFMKERRLFNFGMLAPGAKKLS